MTVDHTNPFWVQTPEDIGAEQANRLFVDIFTDFPEAESKLHSFISGPRGSGKSMMFRMMRPDCLCLRRKCTLTELPYLGIYVPIKSTKINLTELLRLEDHPAKYVFNEHLLCLYFAIKAFEELASGHCDYTGAAYSTAESTAWASEVVYGRLRAGGATIEMEHDSNKERNQDARTFFGERWTF